MKILERFALILFSIIMLVLAVMNCLVMFDIVELKSIYNFLEDLIEYDVARKIIICTSIVSILLAIKALFFPSKTAKQQEVKTGVLLENKDGRLLISRDTIENMVNSIVKSFQEVLDIQTKINLDSSSNITVYISLLVKEDSLIKELSSNIQNKIKDTIKRSTGLEVNQVNINIKDIDSTRKNNNQVKINADGVQIIETDNIKTNNTQIQKNDNIEEKFQINQNSNEENNIIINQNQAEKEIQTYDIQNIQKDEEFSVVK